jgi:ATP-dependent RNA helicase SUPV3L1/SUV3
MYMPLDYGNMDEFFETLKDNAENVLYYIFGFEGFDGIRNEIANRFMEVLEDADKVKKIIEEHPSFEVLNVVLQNGKIKADMMQEVYYVLDDATTTYAYNIINTLKGELTKKNILKWLQKNKHFTGILEYHQKLDETFNSIPDNYAELYPMARRMIRHFTIHIGPTNSGKTWAAMNTLKQSSNGAYLAPLRLLAFEKYEELNMEGYTASLITGEEQLIQEDALFTCSTIEMANLGQKYDCVVVDECQMLADSQRGGAWTNAILGLQCEDIHLCTSPDALDILVKMIELCDDSYDVVNHERKNELVMEEDVIHFPDNIQKGDALIVFSKRDVHGVASELKEAGISCSIIYGALPYDVRQREAQKFCNGETDVVVATDAIGMGLNLPIRRVVFLKTKKFDGVSERELTGNELRQIAGRAGRYGIFEKGLYNFSSLELKDKKRFEREINTPASQIDLARIDCPRTLIMGMDIHISDVLSKWNNIPLQEGFFKQDVDTKISLATELENFTDDKEFIYTFINFGLDTKNEEIMALWRALYKSELEGKEYRYSKDAISIPEDPTIDKLDELENTFKLCDLLYQYYYNFGYTKNMNDIMVAKKQISTAIMQILSKNKLKARVCKHCGLKLTWDYPYNMCAKCHSMRYPRYGSRYNYYNYYN